MSAVARSDGRLTVALVSEVFWQPDGIGRLEQRLDEAARRGADIALLPELPLHPWRPATQDAVDDDAEPMGGPRMTAQAEAARTAGIGLVGGIIHRDEAGRRRSRALVFDRSGGLVSTFEKLHLPEEPLAASADREKLGQVLTNLLDNAVKFSPNGGTVTVEAHRRAGRVEVRIVDEGQGIPEDERERIFSKFHRADSSPRGQSGAGLGLFIARGLVRAMGGRIWVDSAEGGGSSFAFELPLAETAPASDDGSEGV